MKKTKFSEHIDKLIRENLKMSNKELQLFLKKNHRIELGDGALRTRRHRIQNPKINMSSKEKPVDTYRERKQKADEKTALRKEADTIISENERLRKEVEAMKAMNASRSTHVITPSNSGETSEATAFVIASDWHACETVTASTVNYLNEYNQEIAKKRADDFFRNSLRLVKICSNDIEIKQVVCGLLGDFINNMIHEEAQETNSMLPVHEAMFVQDLIIAGINYWLENSDLSFIFVCHSGNHARSSKKQRHGVGDSGYSYEYMMYHAIANRFYGNKRVQFVIPDSYHSYITVYDMVVRFHHGHDIRYAGGVGGLTIPVNKAIAQWNKAKKADLDVFGHFHQFFDGGNFICNGSMVGWNSYAIAIKASYEKPKQAFFLIDRKRGKTIVAPVLFDI